MTGLSQLCLMLSWSTMLPIFSLSPSSHHYQFLKHSCYVFMICSCLCYVFVKLLKILSHMLEKGESKVQIFGQGGAIKRPPMDEMT